MTSVSVRSSVPVRSPLQLVCTLTSGLFVAALAAHSGVGVGKARGDLSRVPDHRNLPIAFELNQGQTDEGVDFLVRGPGYRAFLTPSEAVLCLAGPAEASGRSAPGSDPPRVKTRVLRMQLVGADPQARVSGMERLPGTSTYLLGNDPGKWLKKVPHYAKVCYRDVYPAIDLVYHRSPSQPSDELEYDFVVAPGADPEQIRLCFAGAERLELDDQGDLLLGVSDTVVRQRRPLIYQEVNGERIEVAGGYHVTGDSEVRFEIGAYEPALPLVIDPVLSYSTYMGGSDLDFVWDLAVDGSGNVYLRGETRSVDFPTVNPVQPFWAGGLDVFVAKLDPTGTTLLYSTYLGGSLSDTAGGIEVDAAGNAYLTGATRSFDFPTLNALQPLHSGAFPSRDYFVAKLDPTGSLSYSTYLGGSADEAGGGIDVDAVGNTYVTGATRSGNFPLMNPIQPASGGFSDLFVTKISPGGSLLYSTYVGGSGDDVGYGIDVGTSGSVVVAGATISGNFPTVNAFQPGYGGQVDGFVLRINAAGSALDYSTYLGGTGFDYTAGVRSDASGAVYVTGVTFSTNFPTAGALQFADRIAEPRRRVCEKHNNAIYHNRASSPAQLIRHPARIHGAV